ncbi:unnamed protein product [Urochloa humidicola]
MQGTPFADICELTDVSEGLIIRTIVRLDETCREFRNAASITRNSALYKKMDASNAIKRDIVLQPACMSQESDTCKPLSEKFVSAVVGIQFVGGSLAVARSKQLHGMKETMVFNVR